MKTTKLVSSDWAVFCELYEEALIQIKEWQDRNFVFLSDEGKREVMHKYIDEKAEQCLG